MAKQKPAGTKRKPPKKSFDPETFPYFTPIAFAVIFVALLILFGEFVFSDKMLFGSDTIQAGIFFRSFYVDYVHEHGAVPQWNPYIFGGMPYVEAFHGDIFYPLSVAKFFGSIYRMLGLILFFHIFLAGLFMYFAARQFRLSKVASLLSAVGYMFASSLISLVSPGHDGKIFVTTLFPLVILFLDRGFQSDRFVKALLNFSLLGLVIGVMFLSPHPQMSYFTLWALSFYALFKLICAYVETRSLPQLARPAALTAYAVVIGLLLSAIQFYPSYVYTTQFSPRAADDTKSGWAWATSWSLHEEEAFSQLIPEFSGTSSRSVKTYYWGKNPFKDNSEAVGIVSIFMALMGFFFYRRRESYFFGGLALFALAYALGATTPLFKMFYYLIPKVKSLRAPSMIMFLFSFSIALLAGMGLQAVLGNGTRTKRTAGKRLNYLLIGLPIIMLILAVALNTNGRGMLSMWTSLFYGGAATTYVQQGVSKLDVAYMNLPAIQSGAWYAFLFTAGAALLVWLYRTGKTGRGILVALLFLPVIDGVRFNKRFVHAVDPIQYWQRNPVADFFHQREGKYRVMNFLGRAIEEDLLPFFGVEVVVGYHGNQLRWYDELLGGPGQSNRANPHFLNLVGAEYILFPTNQQFPEGYLGDRPVTTAATFGPITVLHNENALPRAFLAGQYRVFTGRKEIYPEVLAGADDLRKVVYLEEEPSLRISTDTTSSDSAWIVDYQNESVLVGVNCTDNRILVLTDNYYDAWQVLVDGRPAKLHRAYGTFRAVEVPAGTREVHFRYKSHRYVLGRTVTWLTMIYLIIATGFCLLKTGFDRRNKEVQH